MSPESDYKCPDENYKEVFLGISAADSDLNFIICCLQHPSPTSPLSKLLQQCALFPLLCTDNKQLHSSADSPSTKAMLIILKHTAPVKLIIVLAFCCWTNN